MDAPFYQEFKQPEASAYPGVYWFWHSIPQPQVIEQQLEEIQHAGYRTFMIQPRLAFPMRDYLSQGYLDAYRYAMRTARKLGLQAGLYDDYNWISGHAGGRTVAGHDHLRERHLFWCQAPAAGGRATCTVSGIHNRLGDGLGDGVWDWIYEGGAPRWRDWQIIRAYAVLNDGAEIDVRAHARLMNGEESGCQVGFDLRGQDLEGARVIAFVSARCGTSRLVNYLHPETAERFIEVGCEPYRRALEDYFGDPLTFLFFDQPYAGFYTWNEHFGNPLNSLMYDESLETAFNEARAYDLGQALLALVLPDSQQSSRLRCDFYETYGELARARFLAPLAAWARQHGLDFAGHELLSFVGEWGFAGGLDALDSRVNFGADFFAIDAYKTISSVDACNYHPQVSARFGASLARAHGRRGCFIEQYSVPVGRELPAPAGQWDLTLDDLRSQAIRHALSGAGRFIFHAFYQTNACDAQATPLASPRFDFPPGINFTPWFKFHPAFAEELARLNAFLGQAEPIQRVALLYPLRTYWNGGPTHAFNAESRFWNRWLSEHRIGYAIIDERQVDAAALQENGFRVLVLPAADVVRDLGFLEALQQFADSGGWVIASGALPGAAQENGLDGALGARAAALFSQHPHLMRYADWQAAEADEDLAGWFAPILSGVQVKAEDESGLPLWCWQGETPTGYALALFNDAQDETLVRLKAPGEYACLHCDAACGSCSRWGWYELNAGETVIHLPLKPRELVCLRLEAGGFIQQQPHLLVWEGEACLDHAWLDEQDRLDVALRCTRPGTLRLMIASKTVPQINLPQEQFSVIPHVEGTWQVEIYISPLPDQISLDQGWRLRIPGEYHDVSLDLRQGWESRYPYYAGPGYYRCHFTLEESDLDLGWLLHCPEVVTALVGYVNQTWVGARGWPPYQLALPAGALKVSYNQIEIAVWNTAGNAYYQNTPYQRSVPHPSGLIGYPLLKPFLEVRLSAANGFGKEHEI